jgi:4-oxalocrotonate tautomerase
MPILQVHMLEGRTLEQKKGLVQALTEDVVKILNVKPEVVTIIIDEVKRSNLAKMASYSTLPS